MSGTRGRQIRLDIAGVMEGLTLDRRAGTADSFKFMDVPRRPESAPERCFRVLISAQPVKDRHNTSDSFTKEFLIERYYALGSDVESRISDDSERMQAPLESLQEVNAGVHFSDVAPLGVEETQNNYIARDSVIVTYRLDSAVVG